MVPANTATVSNGTSRVEAFSDGVFAIAVTLLVLDIHVPEVKGDVSLLHVLGEQWEHYLAFVIGFFTLLVCWINHHYMFEIICKTNGMLLLLNGFKLLVVSFTPFSTAILSKYIGTPHQRIAVILYAANFFFMGLAMTCLWLYANKHDLVKAEPPQVLKASKRLYIFATLLSGTILVLSFFSIPVSLVLFGLMFLIFVFPKNMVNRIKK